MREQKIIPIKNLLGYEKEKDRLFWIADNSNAEKVNNRGEKVVGFPGFEYLKSNIINYLKTGIYLE